MVAPTDNLCKQLHYVWFWPWNDVVKLDFVTCLSKYHSLNRPERRITARHGGSALQVYFRINKIICPKTLHLSLNSWLELCYCISTAAAPTCSSSSSTSSTCHRWRLIQRARAKPADGRWWAQLANYRRVHHPRGWGKREKGKKGRCTCIGERRRGHILFNCVLWWWHNGAGCWLQCKPI